ncbi:MAG: putative hydrolase YutF [Candidatus Lokiarchaeum sp. GC14_75]|nr:MAG: putative hydrolase YutF [Candidatus Lokiarchaeum sp. GC14_75]
MPELIDKLKYIKLAIFDLDGVVYRGDKLIPNAEKIIKELKRKSIEIVYNTNNSTITRQSYVERLKQFGITSNLSDFYTSASITSAEITRIKTNAKIYVIGETGLRDELKSLGHTIETNPTIYKDIDFVIVGLDRDFSYDKLAFAQRCILEGDAQFYATNLDFTLPVAIGLKPGAGVMVNAVTTCTDKKPIRIFGKPEPFGIKLILKDRKFSPEEACIFGDRLNTDILAGNRAGIISVAVLTGVSTKKMINDLKKKVKEKLDVDVKMLPDLVINKLDDIFKRA